jgi:hypothetical protein
MPVTKTIVCLANSRKLSGRCGGVETHTETEDRLICCAGLAGNLLRTREEALIEACALRAGRVAYAEEPTSPTVQAR